MGLLGLALLPAEHIHSRIEDGHHSEIVHRHFEAHHPVSTDPSVDHDDEDGAQYLTTAFTVAKPASGAYPGSEYVVIAFPIPQTRLVSRRSTPRSFTSVHDPPWRVSSGLRAPPLAV